MNSHHLRAIAFNACLLVGCAAIAVTWQASGADGPSTKPARHARPIFVCRGHGVAVFSDLPCGPAGEERTLRVDEPGAGAGATTVPSPVAAATRPQPRRATGDRDASERRPPADGDRCRRLHERRDALDERMRTGYSAREAAQLWSRWRDANAEIYAARCGRS